MWATTGRSGGGGEDTDVGEKESERSSIPTANPNQDVLFISIFSYAEEGH
jgi:hypothetical protein